jgi:EAL and modified HD-GYP domain-containing signal transduction protein
MDVSKETSFFIGRQPIFNRRLGVYGYELLFRESSQNAAGVQDGDRATAQVILNTLVEVGLEKLVGGKRAFINLTYDFIVGHYLLPFPKNRVVLEVLESCAVDERLLGGLRTFFQNGYTIALDDFVLIEERVPMLETAHIIKLDLQALGRTDLKDQVSRLGCYGVKLLAEKVETQDELEFCAALGFDYFQGYFFSRPDVVTVRRLPQNRMAVLRLLAMLQNPDTEIKQLEEIISKDVSLSYRLLRIINSAFYSLPNKVDSIHRAVVLLGTQAIKNWATLIVLSGNNDKPTELMRTMLVRARMCELLAAQSGQGEVKDSFFVVGLFSGLDALMSCPMKDVISSLPLTDAIVNALLEHRGPEGAALDCVLAYERTDWSAVTCPGLGSGEITRAWLEALDWATAASRELGLE